MTSRFSAFFKSPLILIFVVFMVAYLGVWKIFTKEGRPSLSAPDANASAIHMELHMLNVDVVRDTATFTIAPASQSKALFKNEHLTKELLVEVDTGMAVLSHKFNKNDSVLPWQVTVPLSFGDVLEYPFDKHSGSFFIKVSSDGGPSQPAFIEFTKVMHGFVAASSVRNESENTQVDFNFEIKRSPAVLFLALMAMFAVTMVVFSAINVAKHVALHGRKVEFGMLVWMAALLFVIPAARNGLPASPPPGALVDIGLFFWLQIFAAGSLLTVAYRWTKQA